MAALLSLLALAAALAAAIARDRRAPEATPGHARSATRPASSSTTRRAPLLLAWPGGGPSGVAPAPGGATAAPALSAHVREDVRMPAATDLAAPPTLDRLGLVVHPRRNLDDALATIRDWAERHDVELGQVEVAGQGRRVAEPIDPATCDLVLALGGDGTALAALHAGATALRPVLGIACGSIGALTSVAVDRLAWALEEVREGRWSPQPLSGLEASSEGATIAIALNDFVVARVGGGQVVTAITADGVLYARVAGDGVVVATPHGSSAYSMAAGGPLLAPGADGFVVTALAAHGASCPPLVLAASSRLELAVAGGYGGMRFELDGQPSAATAERVELRLRPGYATRVELASEEPLLTGLRRRGLVLDSPRVKIRDGRAHQDPA